MPDLDSSPVFHAGAEAGFESRTEVHHAEIAGVYPYVCTFPGHGLLMYGAMYVGVPMPPLEKDGNVPEAARQGKTEARQFHAWGEKRPLMYRIFMPEASPAAIAVALKHGQNYCWDAGQCRLRYAWYGGFVDPWPVWRVTVTAWPRCSARSIGNRMCPVRLRSATANLSRSFGLPESRWAAGVSLPRERGGRLRVDYATPFGDWDTAVVSDPEQHKPVVLPVGPTGRWHLNTAQAN